MATRDVFSEDEMAQLRGFPEPGRAELIRFFTLAPTDAAFLRKFRGRDNIRRDGLSCGTPGPARLTHVATIGANRR